MTGLSEQQLAEIQAVAEAATAGPWGSHRDLDGVYTVQARPRITSSEGNTTDGDIARVCASEDGQAYADARFIAMARESVPALLARVAELEAERHQANEVLDDAVRELRAKDQRIAELERSLRAARQAKSEYHDDLAGALGYPHADWADLIDLAATNTAMIAKAGGPDGR